MLYFLVFVALVVRLFWMVSITPWLKGLRKPEPEPKFEIGKFERFVFPIIRRASPALIAQNLVSVQPMTAPNSMLFYLESRYGKKVHRTVLDDIVDALIASETDPEQIAEQIVRDAFKDHPYSTYYRPESAIKFDGLESAAV